MEGRKKSISSKTDQYKSSNLDERKKQKDCKEMNGASGTYRTETKGLTCLSSESQKERWS